MDLPRPLSLDQLTVIGASPAKLVDLAAAAGFAAISPWIGVNQYPGLPAVHLRAGDPETVAMARRLRETGVQLNQADGFGLIEDTPMEAFREGIALMAELGARNVIALHFDSDDNRAFDRFCQLDLWAQEAGIGVAVEFTAISSLATLDDTLAFLARVNSPNTGILVDILHLMQSGATPADLARVPPGMIRGAQLCDGPGPSDQGAYTHQSIKHRLWPGEGALPVTDFLRALPDDIIIGVEVPRDEPGLSLEDRAATAMATGAAALRAASDPR